MARLQDEGYEALYGAGQQYVASSSYSLNGGGFNDYNVGNMAEEKISDGLGHWWDSSTQSWQNDSGGAYQSYEPPQNYSLGGSGFQDFNVGNMSNSDGLGHSWDSSQQAWINDNDGSLYDPQQSMAYIPFAPDSWNEPAPEETNYSLNFGSSAFGGYGSPNAQNPWGANNQQEDDTPWWQKAGGALGDSFVDTAKTFGNVIAAPYVAAESAFSDKTDTGFNERVGANFSGEKFQDTLGIDTEYMDWLRKQGLLGKTAAYGIDTLTAPATLLTAGLGPEAGMIGSAFGGGFGKQLAGETALGVAGYLGADAANSDVADKIPYFSDQPDWLRGLEGGAVAGIGAFGGIKAAGKALDTAGGFKGLLAGEGGETPPLFPKGQGDARLQFSDMKAKGDSAVGLPPGVKSQGDLDALTARVRESAEAGAEFRHWYENSGAWILDANGGDVDGATKSAILIAWGSTDTSVKGQGAFFPVAQAEMSAGLPITKGNRYTAVNKQMETMARLYDTNREAFINKVVDLVSTSAKDSKAPKIGAFFTDLVDDINPALAAEIRARSGVGMTVDRWMARAYGFPSDVVTPAQRAFIQADQAAIAAELGWKPKQVQAATWVNHMWEELTTKALAEGKPAPLLEEVGMDYSQALARHVAQISLETMPAEDSALARVLDGIFNQPPQVQAELHAALSKVGLDEAGNDILARKMGLPILGRFEGPGVEKLPTGTTVHPGTQIQVSVPSLDSASKGIVSPVVAQQVSDYAALTAFFREQRAAPWTRVFDDPSKFHHNGFLLDLGEEIDPARAKAIADILDDSHVILPHPQGAIVFAIPDSFDVAARGQAIKGEAQKVLKAKNDVRRANIQAAIERVFPEDVNGYTIATDGAYVTREMGEELLNAVGKQGSPAYLSPDLRETVYALQRASRQTAEDFAAKYNLGQYATAPRSFPERLGGLDAAGYSPHASPDIPRVPEFDSLQGADSAGLERMASRTPPPRTPASSAPPPRTPSLPTDTAPKPLKSAADIVNPETGTPDVAQYVNADAVSRRRILDSFQDVATREGRPTGGIYDDILPTEQVKTGLMRGYEGKTGTAGLALQRDLDNGNRALRQVDIGRMNGRSLQVSPKRINGKVDPNDDVVQLFKALHGEGEPPPKLKPVFDDLKRMVAEETDDTLRQNKDFVLKDDYFYRGWKAPRETASGVGKGQVGAKPGYQKPRVDATFSELIEQGWEPLSWNPYEMASLRRYAGVQFREQKALVDALKKTGLAVTIDGGTPVGWRVPRVGPAFEGKPFAFTPDAAPLADAVGAKVGYTPQYAVPDKLANEIENIFGKTPDMGAILNTIAGAGQKAKQLKLVASLFQQVDFATRQGAAGFASAIDSLVAGQPLSAVKKLITVPSDMAKLPISNLSGARQRQLRDMILDGKPLLKERPGVSLKSISDAGWSTSDITVVNRTIKQSLDDMLADPKGLRKLASDVGGDANITGAPLRTLKKLNEASQRGLFEGVYPQAQATTLKKFVVPKLVRQHPEWTDAQISAAAATEINKMFSTLGNFQQVVKNPVSKKFLGSLIFSTNETESLLRQAASTVVGPNKAMWTEYYAGAFVFLAATANLVNYAATGEPLDLGDYSPVKKDPYSPLGVGYNNRFMAPQVPFLKGRNGTPVRLDLMGQLDTVFRMLDPHGFIESRENVIPRAAMSQMQGEDFFGRPLKGPKERIGQLAADLFEPIGAQQVRGALDIGPDSEGRLGNIGQAIQGSGVNLRAEPTRDMKDRLAQDTYGKKWDELSPTQQENIKRENPNFQSELDTRRDESAAQNNEYAIRQKAAADATALLTTQQTASDEKRDSGQLTPEQWRKDYTERKNELYLRNDQIYADAGDFETQDPIRAPFYKAIDDATGKDGKVDWDKVDAYRATLSAKDNAYLDWETGLTRIVTPKTQEFKEDYDAIKASGYFARSDVAWKDVAGLVPTWNALGTPVNPSDYDDYYEWRQAALKAGLDLAGKTFEDIATVTQIESWLDKQEPAKGMDYYGAKWKDQWVAENPREAYDAWKYGYYTPKKEIKAWLAGQFE